MSAPQFCCVLTHSTPAGQTASPHAVAEASLLLSDDLQEVTATSASNAHESDRVRIGEMLSRRAEPRADRTASPVTSTLTLLEGA